MAQHMRFICSLLALITGLLVVAQALSPDPLAPVFWAVDGFFLVCAVCAVYEHRRGSVHPYVAAPDSDDV